MVVKGSAVFGGGIKPIKDKRLEDKKIRAAMVLFSKIFIRIYFFGRRRAYLYPANLAKEEFLSFTRNVEKTLEELEGIELGSVIEEIRQVSSTMSHLVPIVLEKSSTKEIYVVLEQVAVQANNIAKDLQAILNRQRAEKINRMKALVRKARGELL